MQVYGKIVVGENRFGRLKGGAVVSQFIECKDASV